MNNTQPTNSGKAQINWSNRLASRRHNHGVQKQIQSRILSGPRPCHSWLTFSSLSCESSNILFKIAFGNSRSRKHSLWLHFYTSSWLSLDQVSSIVLGTLETVMGQEPCLYRAWYQERAVFLLGATFQSAAAAAAKSLKSCPTLCDPIDSSLPGFPVPGILQARTLEWVAISFSNAWQWKVKDLLV